MAHEKLTADDVAALTKLSPLDPEVRRWAVGLLKAAGNPTDPLERAKVLFAAVREATPWMPDPGAASEPPADKKEAVAQGMWLLLNLCKTVGIEAAQLDLALSRREHVNMLCPALRSPEDLRRVPGQFGLYTLTVGCVLPLGHERDCDFREGEPRTIRNERICPQCGEPMWLKKEAAHLLDLECLQCGHGRTLSAEPAPPEGAQLGDLAGAQRWAKEWVEFIAVGNASLGTSWAEQGFSPEAVRYFEAQLAVAHLEGQKHERKGRN